MITNSGRSKVVAERSPIKVSTIFGVLFGILLLVTAVSLIRFGPHYSPDTIHYFRIARGNPESLQYLSPLYPFFISLSDFLPLSGFDMAFLVVILGYIIGFVIIYLISKKIYTLPSNILFYSMGISLMSWWSFRVMGSAHADALFYLLIIVWLYQFLLGDKKNHSYFWSLGLLSAFFPWVQLNSLFLIFFLTIWVILNKDKRWLIVLGCLLVSFACYQIVVPKNILLEHLLEGINTNPISSSALLLLYQNLATWFKVVIGIIFSDHISHYIPNIIGFMGSLGLLGAKIYLLTKGKNRIGKPTYALLLFAASYGFVFLTFQQWIGFEEIGFRTLFPYLLAVSWAFWIEMNVRGKLVIQFLVCLFIVSHTLMGHFYHWQKEDDMASLLEVQEFINSPASEAVGDVLIKSPYEILTDQPEKMGLAFLEIPIAHVGPEIQLVNGENLLLSPEEKALWIKQSEEALITGHAILILFQKSKYWESFSQNENLYLEERHGIWMIYQP
ncbi:MAG: hypothetical protein WD398_00745 [Cyclobacteriaceae bacterium]